MSGPAIHELCSVTGLRTASASKLYARNLASASLAPPAGAAAPAAAEAPAVDSLAFGASASGVGVAVAVALSDICAESAEAQTDEINGCRID
jgi:hypothetical protein